MKRTSILLCVLLALVAFSHADSINLTSGSGKVYPLFVLPGFSFQFFSAIAVVSGPHLAQTKCRVERLPRMYKCLIAPTPLAHRVALIMTTVSFPM